jgi:glycosyltransferase involved in cell wall biosynthesis
VKKKLKKFTASISLIIPTYNNEETIVGQLRSCEKILESMYNDYEIIISDDLSKDKTVKLLKKSFYGNENFRLIFQKKNLGIGKNIKYLYKSAKKDYVILYSADGEWNPNDIKEMLLVRETQKADLVIGKRIKKEGYNFRRNIVSLFFRLLTLLFFYVDTVDAGSIKLVKREILSEPLLSESIFLEAEIIIKAKQNGYRVISLPVRYKKPEEMSGSAGKFSVIFHAFADLIKFRVFSLRRAF